METKRMHRLFVGLRPPPSIRDQLLDLMTDVPGARWQDDEQLHLTTRFIGAVDRPVAEDIAAALDALRSPLPPLQLSGVGCFDSGGRVNALWAGVTPRGPLTALHQKVDALLVRLGLPPERRAYLPHITVARLNRSAAPTDIWLARHAGFSSAPFEIDHLTLFESHLTPGGAHYESVARYPLR